ncbi:MAG: alcohol dehydrogenase catalytic domain-containing protein [Clostridia bacterium]|nr:alcohol dehydrogenase catalytic domain-containing protein [Clostridia bacterium]
MKAAMWRGTNDIEIVDLPLPTLNEGEALIKVRAAGICATDYHIISGKLKLSRAPHVQGHEICGEVVEINDAGCTVPIGQRCVIATSVGCGRCPACREGKQYLCPEGSEIGYYPHSGGYAEYLKVPTSAIVPIPDEVSDRTAAILESCVCPTESLMRIGVTLGGTVVVFGAGPAGLAFIKLSRILGAARVVSVVRSEHSEERAREFGATHVINTKLTADPVGALLDITGGTLADLVVEATGAPSVIESSFNYVKRGGDIILYGIPGDDDVVTMPTKKIVVEEITVHGAVGNTKAWEPLVRMIAAGSLSLDAMVTHEFKLEDIDRAFDLYRTHDKSLIKAIIKF